MTYKIKYTAYLQGRMKTEKGAFELETHLPPEMKDAVLIRIQREIGKKYGIEAYKVRIDKVMICE